MPNTHTNLLKNLQKQYPKAIKKTHFPTELKPMLCKLYKEIPTEENRIYEDKLDGQRFIVEKHNNTVTIFSRYRKKQNDFFPELIKPLQNIYPGDYIVDGELVTFNDKGVSSFKKLQERIHTQDPSKELQERVPVVLYLFDLMYIDQYNITKLPLTERKKLLKNAFNFNENTTNSQTDSKNPSTIRYTQHRRNNPKQFFKEIAQQGGEGIIAKDGTSHYLQKRSSKRRKIKTSKRQELVIGGYTAPQGERKHFGSLLVGYYDNDKFRYAGKVGTGFDEETLKNLHKKMQPLERKTSPFDDKPEVEKDEQMLTPKLVCEVGFTERTQHGRLRHPRYLGLRIDKSAEEVVKESTT